MFEFRQNLASREKCAKLVDPTIDRVHLTKEKEQADVHELNGHVFSPLARHVPELLPPPNDNAVFQMVRPKRIGSQSLRPAVIHLAATGDHGFRRRRLLIADSLAKQHGVTSLILENPFYGRRKPEQQRRSCLRNVTDLFIMGGCLMLECHVLLHWLKSQGYGPLGVTGISLGGHMASLAAGAYTEPVSLIPCLSWSTASGVFTDGVMSHALPWRLLKEQYHDGHFRDTVPKVVGHYNVAFRAGQQFVRTYASQIDETKTDRSSCAENLSCDQNPSGQSDQQQQAKRLLQRVWSKLKINKSSVLGINAIGGSSRPTDDEVLQFMRGVMDEFTHLGNFSAPLDMQLVISVQALKDAYVPRDHVTDLRHIWPGIDVRYITAGHVAAYMLHRAVFQQAILDSLTISCKKYYQKDNWLN